MILSLKLKNDPENLYKNAKIQSGWNGLIINQTFIDLAILHQKCKYIINEYQRMPMLAND